MKEDKNEEKWDRLLRIRTTGRDDSHADQYRYPYEPTPYSVLNAWPSPEESGKNRCCWIMDVEKEE